MIPRRLVLTVALGLICGMSWASARRLIIEDCAGTRPACTQPPAATIAPAQWQTAVIPLLATPIELDDCALPRATCSQPVAATVVVAGHSVVTRSRPSVAEYLSRWERLTTNHDAVGERDLAWMMRRNESLFSKHTIATVARLMGPIDVAYLQAEFTWTAIAVDDHRVALTATPNDETSRLFCPRLRVMLDQQSGEPQAWDVGTRDGQWLAVKTPGPMPESESIILTKFAVDVAGNSVAEVPPSPAPQRFASDGVTQPVLR